MMNEFEDAIVNLDIDKATAVCKDLLMGPSKVETDEIFKSIGRALDVVGRRYEEGEYFLSELIMAGEVVKEVLKIAPVDESSVRKTFATVVLATVRGDLHDIGKNILSMLLQSSGFKVFDLGIDVPAEDIVKAVNEHHPSVVGLSALLSTTVPEFGRVVTELERTELRGKVKVIVGGAAVNEEVAKQYRVDGWGRTAVDGLRTVKRWVGVGEA